MTRSLLETLDLIAVGESVTIKKGIPINNMDDAISVTRSYVDAKGQRWTVGQIVDGKLLWLMRGDRLAHAIKVTADKLHRQMEHKP